METQPSQIFRIADTKENVICPPDQVFINPNFVFLLTIGGHLADGEEEYQKLMKLLKELGETEFYLLQNIEQSYKTIRNERTFPVDSDFKHFDTTVQAIEPILEFMSNHWFVFGKNKNWGIYICEYPTINIIGCTEELQESFSKVFNIIGNGFLEQVDFIAKEYQHYHKDDWLDKLVKNYHLQN